MKKLVIFDVCGTLYNSNTTFDFLDYFLRNNKIYKIFNKLRKLTVIKAINKVFFKLFGKDLIRIYALKFIRNVPRNRLLGEAREFVKGLEKIGPTHQLLESYMNRGYDVIIISASLDFLIEVISDELKVDTFFATKLVYRNNICEGAIEKDLLGNKGEILNSIKGKYNEIITVTDNKSDFDIIVESNKCIIVSSSKNLNYWDSLKNKLNIEQIIEV